MNTASTQPPQDRRARTRKEIKQPITERNSVLSQYYSLASHADQRTDYDNPEDVLEMLQEFCQDLVDYMATGHFEIYRRIEDGDERRTEMIELAEKIFPHITNTTQIAIDFNDLYDISKDFDVGVLKGLSRQLSILGENLATRIDLEDKFINTILSLPPNLTTASA
jgi:regulator of sigma D